MSIEEGRLAAKIKELREDSDYMDNLVKDILINEGIPITTESKSNILNSSWFTPYLTDIAREHISIEENNND